MVTDLFMYQKLKSHNTYLEDLHMKQHARRIRYPESSCAILLPFLQEFGLEIDQESQIDPWLVLVTRVRLVFRLPLLPFFPQTGPLKKISHRECFCC